MSSNENVEVSLYYLQRAREALVWKVEGLSPYDARRPMTPTGTNLLGLVKHVAITEHGYLGELLGHRIALPDGWDDEDEENVDLWVRADQPAQTVLDTYRAVWANSDATVRRLGADATTEVPWWPEERRKVTVALLLTHVIAETNRHAGHADIVRETIDGAVGLSSRNSNLPEQDADWWRRYRQHVEEQAAAANR